jgi:integrase
MTRLTDKKIKSITTPGRYPDGNNLYLNVSSSLRKSWTCRVTVSGGLRRDIGLGSYPAVSLKEARQKRDAVALDAANGRDPLRERKAAEAEKARLQSMTFERAALACFEMKQAEWKNGKHQDQWINTLTTYAFPIIGSMTVADIEARHVVRCLKPIWLTKKETAKRVRQRIDTVMRWAKAMGYRTGDNPAALEGNLEYLLPAQRQTVVHHPAMPFEQLPAFWEELSSVQTVSADALRFLILTAARSGEVREATWDEVDFGNALWSLPEARMKASKPHQVPLCDEAVRILQKRRQLSLSQYIFESQRAGHPMSDMAMLSLMRKRLPQINAVPHGFRSTFRDWAENQSYPHRAVEYCLAHTVRNKTEAAYQRDDLLSIRRKIMTDYGSMTINN